MSERISPADRILRHVLAAGDCWLWLGGLDDDGYGKAAVARVPGDWRHGKRSVRAHRLAYETFVGPVPEGLTLDHLCRNRWCVNPSHLEPVTHRENILRGEGLASANALKTHCARGHLLAGDNLIVSAKQRACRECQRRASREYQRRRRAAA